MTDLKHAVQNGYATDDELVEYLGVDALNAAYANRAPRQQLEDEFNQFWATFGRPAGVGRPKLWALFTGAMTIEQFVDSLDEAQLEVFTQHYEANRTAFLAAIEQADR